MSSIRSTRRTKFNSPFTKLGRLQERVDSLPGRVNVNKEYMKVFRTKSYMEMWSKVQGQLTRTSFDGIDKQPTSPSLPSCAHLSKQLLEPKQDTLMEMIGSLKFDPLIIDYFEASLEACDICELLFRSIHQARADYRKIRRVIKLSKRAHDDRHEDGTDINILRGAMLRELGSFALLKNPLSIISPVQFREIHDSNMELLRKLTLKQKKVRRRAKFKRIFKKVGGCTLVISHSAIVIALLVFALHSMVGFVAAPALVAGAMALINKKSKLVEQPLIKTSLLDRLGAQLDIAAKGMYILINDFDTMSRLARRIHDEIEHLKVIANMCVRNGKTEILVEVVKEFYTHESCFVEQLEELEQHIYLCFHTINRSRRLVIQEIMVGQE